MVLPDDVRALLDGPNTAHFASVLADGAPHSAPVWVGLEQERIAVLTSPSSVKARNVERDLRVAISLTARDDPFTMATVRGRVIERLDGLPAWAIIDRISEKYTGAPYSERTDRVVYLIDVEHARAQAFG